MKNGNMNGHMLVSNNCIFSIANAKADCFFFFIFSNCNRDFCRSYSNAILKNSVRDFLLARSQGLFGFFLFLALQHILYQLRLELTARNKNSNLDS